MSNAINFMGDYIQCIELDRFVGFDSETDLEWEAAKLSRTKNLLAGRFMFHYTVNLEIFGEGFIFGKHHICKVP